MAFRGVAMTAWRSKPRVLGETDLASIAENGKRKTENAASSAPEITPLLAAARRAMNPGGYPAPVATLPSVDEQLAAMGLESDTERLYRRMGDEKKETVDGGEATVDGLRLTVDGEKREESERVAGVVGASRAGEGVESQAKTVSVFRFPFSGEKAGAAAEGGGNGSSGRKRNRGRHGDSKPGNRIWQRLRKTEGTAEKGGKRPMIEAPKVRRSASPQRKPETTEPGRTRPDSGKRKTENGKRQRRR